MPRRAPVEPEEEEEKEDLPNNQCHPNFLRAVPEEVVVDPFPRRRRRLRRFIFLRMVNLIPENGLAWRVVLEGTRAPFLERRVRLLPHDDEVPLRRHSPEPMDTLMTMVKLIWRI